MTINVVHKGKFYIDEVCLINGLIQVYPKHLKTKTMIAMWSGSLVLMYEHSIPILMATIEKFEQTGDASYLSIERSLTSKLFGKVDTNIVIGTKQYYYILKLDIDQTVDVLSFTQVKYGMDYASGTGGPAMLAGLRLGYSSAKIGKAIKECTTTTGGKVYQFDSAQLKELV